MKIMRERACAETSTIASDACADFNLVRLALQANNPLSSCGRAHHFAGDQWQASRKVAAIADHRHLLFPSVETMNLRAMAIGFSFE